MKSMFALVGLLALAPVAFADSPQVYKWTDAAGVIHYSDKPPTEPTADLQSLDMPAFPAADPAAIAAHQVQLDAEAQAARQQLQAQLEDEAQALAAQNARLQAELAAAQQQAASQPAVEPIYVNSAFVPRVYRANLYFTHHRRDSDHPSMSRPAVPVLKGPK